jgi:hypothetical protein
MGASPEMFRGVDGSRIAAVSVSFKPCDHRASSCASISVSRQAVRIALAFDEQSRSKQRREGDLLPCRDAAFVQMNVENRTGDFVPRFSIMHGCIESRAGH